MSNFKSVKKFMEKFGQEIKEKASFPEDRITSLRYDLIKEELGELKEAMDKKDIKELLRRKSFLRLGFSWQILNRISSDTLVIFKET